MARPGEVGLGMASTDDPRYSRMVAGIVWLHMPIRKNQVVN
jgi:hypothetical protein